MSREQATILEKLFIGVEAICAPVLIVGPNGNVLHANSKGRSLFERDSLMISESLKKTLAGEPNDECVLIPLVGQNDAVHYLAILESIAPAVSMDAVRIRWKLTERQAQVLELVARGMTNATIASILKIGEATVEFHVFRIFDKAGVENRTSLIAQLLRGAAQ